MEPGQDQHGAAFPEPILIEGIRSIYILDSIPLKINKTSPLSYYRGFVRSGSQTAEINACEAIIVKFEESGAETRYNQLVVVDHPCILKALGYGRGVGVHRHHSFLALEVFERTFQAYVHKNGPGIDEFGRFTEDFILMISNIIEGIEELHRLGFYCPRLDADSIVVIRRYDSISAKLWAFKRCTSEKEKEQDGDWQRVGYMIVRAANYDPEANDLFKRIESGEVKGKSILEHNALLTVRKRFKNATTLYFHVSLNYQREPNQSPNQNQSENLESQNQNQSKNQGHWIQASDICAANLKTHLDKGLFWEVPQWVSKRCTTTPPKTLRGFIKQLRIIVEHEAAFIPEEMTRKLTIREVAEGKKVMDLDHHLHGSCRDVLRAVQRLVAELKLNT